MEYEEQLRIAASSKRPWHNSKTLAVLCSWCPCLAKQHMVTKPLLGSREAWWPLTLWIFPSSVPTKNRKSIFGWKSKEVPHAVNTHVKHVVDLHADWNPVLVLGQYLCRTERGVTLAHVGSTHTQGDTQLLFTTWVGNIWHPAYCLINNSKPHATQMWILFLFILLFLFIYSYEVSFLNCIVICEE